MKNSPDIKLKLKKYINSKLKLIINTGTKIKYIPNNHKLVKHELLEQQNNPKLRQKYNIENFF